MTMLKCLEIHESSFKFPCAICGKKISLTDDSEEHIIPASIGGRQTVRKFLHRSCNNKSGQTWDAELSKQLQPLALHFGVQRQRRQTPRMKVKTSTGEDFLLGSKGQLTMAKPNIETMPTNEGISYKIKAATKEEAKKVIEGLKRKHPQINVDETIQTAQFGHSYAQGLVHLGLEFGGDLAGRSLVKSVLALAHAAGVRINLCTDAVGYLRGSAPPCFGYYFIGDLVINRPAGLPLHCIAIHANPNSGLILGYAEYFGVHRAVICLGRGYSKQEIHKTYAFDPRTGKELKLEVALSFNEAEISEIYDYKMDDPRCKVAALKAVFEPALKAQQEAERKRVLEEALAYAWSNCGAVQNVMLTVKDVITITQLFSDRVLPFLTKVEGMDEFTAQLYARNLAYNIFIEVYSH